MTDQEKREKVVALLERYVDIPNLAGIENYGAKIVDMPAPLIADALELLKAQEPVKPVVDIDTWKCGNCGHALEHQQLLGDNVLFHEQYNYCPECGRAVKWDA